MGLEVYYPTDIRNALLAAEQAANATATATGNTDEPFAASFLAGYRAALTTLALAFGLVGTERPVCQAGRQSEADTCLPVGTACLPVGTAWLPVALNVLAGDR